MDKRRLCFMDKYKAIGQARVTRALYSSDESTPCAGGF